MSRSADSSQLLNNDAALMTDKGCKKILLMYITEVSGHHQATLAIEKSLKSLNPRLEILNINGFSYTYPIVEKIVNKAYMSIIKRTPHIWHYLYDNPAVYKKTLSIKKAIQQSNHSKFEKLFSQFQPDVVVCTQAFPCGMVADYKKEHNLNIKIIGVLTDYAPHSYWLHEGVDYYIVPSEEARERFIAEGIAEERIKVFGIPVDPKFTAVLDKKSVAQKLGLDHEKPIVLIMGGGQGLGPIKKVVTALTKSKVELQLIVVAGTNKKLIRWLKKSAQQGRKKTIIYEYAPNVEELMTVATVSITKPGGMTTSESLTKGLPMIIVRPIPGQEVYNTNFLLKKGAAIRVNKVENIAKTVESLLTSTENLALMRNAALSNGRPHASLEIAKLVLQ